MKEHSNITCGILSPLDLSSSSHGSQVLELLSRYGWLIPTNIGNFEPIRGEYRGLADGLKAWKDPFLWKNTASKLKGSVWFGHGEQHSNLYLRLKPRRVSLIQDDLVNFLIEACGVLRADMGYIHLTTHSEMEDKSIPYEYSYAIDTGLTTHDLRKGIPNICRAMVFGIRYKSIAERFENASPLSKFCEIPAKNQWFIQLSPSLDDLRVGYDTFSANRKKLIDEVGSDFISYSGGAEWKPIFTFGK